MRIAVPMRQIENKNQQQHGRTATETKNESAKPKSNIVSANQLAGVYFSGWMGAKCIVHEALKIKIDCEYGL